jgi:autophagy-related protein 11
MLRSTNQSLEASLTAERERSARLERELAEAKSQLETALSARRIVEERTMELSTEAAGRQHTLAEALAEATRRTREAEELRQELAQMRADFQDIKALEERSSQRITALVAEQAETLRHLEEARVRGEDLATQIRSAREEGEDVTRTLKEAAREKDRLLRAQASEHDRMMKELVNEADGDRAVLEHQFSELKAQFDDVSRRLRDKSAQMDAGRTDSDGLRRALEDARQAERTARDELALVQTMRYDLEHRLESSSHLAAQLLDVAIAFRNSHVKALAVAKALSTHPGVSKMSSTLVESILQGSPRDNNGNITDNFLPPIDPGDPNAALETLRAIDHDHFLETISKTGSVIRKWQKQCKEYRERAKGKISFRNFAKGDLALFLPTRNSISKPWAAFNGMWVSH